MVLEALQSELRCGEEGWRCVCAGGAGCWKRLTYGHTKAQTHNPRGVRAERRGGRGEGPWRLTEEGLKDLVTCVFLECNHMCQGDKLCIPC